MSFGNQIVTFVTITEDLNNRDRYNNPAQVRTETPVKGCRFRPLTAKEKLELGDIVTDPWKCTAPPVPAVMNASGGDEVKVNNVTYQIVGDVRTFEDFSVPVKVTVICQRMVS